MNHLVQPSPVSPDEDKRLKSTTSRCPACLSPCAAEVVQRKGRIDLNRICPVHGEFSACIASDARFYWLAQGKESNRDGSCCGGGACCSADGETAGTLGRNSAGRNGSPFEVLSTCLALIEIVNSCNLSCPTCYADSPLMNRRGGGSRPPLTPAHSLRERETDLRAASPSPLLGNGDARATPPSPLWGESWGEGTSRRHEIVPLSDIRQRVDAVIARKGKIEILQFSGGEPTLHPQLIELCRWAKQHSYIDFLLLNTNGVRLAKEPQLCQQLGEVFKDGGLQVYLQFDGVQERGQRALRGTDLRALRETAIANLAAANIPVTLAMTVTNDNLPHLWETVSFGLSRPIIHGITFQPEFFSGRNPNGASFQLARNELHDGATKMVAPPSARLNTADIILAVVEQSGGQLRFEDFTPLPCGDPNCATIGYLIRQKDRVWHVSDFIDLTKLQGFLHDKVRYTLDDLARCGCENEPLGDLLKTLERTRSMAFRIMVKPFMDAWTWDEDRIDRCCTHVIRPDGKLDSFCRYYSGFADCETSP